MADFAAVILSVLQELAVALLIGMSVGAVTYVVVFYVLGRG